MPISGDHPRPAVHRALHRFVLAGLIVLLLTVPLQIVLGFIAPGGLMLLSAGVTLLLSLPLWMYLSATPPLTLRDDGILLRPVVWRERLIPWDDVLVIKDYPLLPQPHNETFTRAMQGRRKYRAAEGVMLVVRGLPPQYRVTGFFVGERARPVIAVTNRSHMPYDEIVATLRQRIGV